MPKIKVKKAFWQKVKKDYELKTVYNTKSRKWGVKLVKKRRK